MLSNNKKDNQVGAIPFILNYTQKLRHLQATAVDKLNKN